MGRRNLAAMFFLGAMFAANAAFADNQEEARVHFKQGVGLYKQGQLVQAAIEFERAYELHPSYKILYNLAQAEAELMHYARASEAYSGYLGAGREEISEARRDEVEKEIARLSTLIGRIVVDCPVDGSVVMIDGERRGDTPLQSSISVDLGQHKVIIIKDGEPLHLEVVRIAGGQEITIKVPTKEIKPQPAEPAAVQEDEPAQQEPAEEAGVKDEKTPSDEVVPVDEAVEEKGGRRLWTWVALGVGVGAGIGGVITGAKTMSINSDIVDNHCNEASKTCDAAYKEDADTMSSLALTTDILLSVAIAGVVTGVVLFFVEPKIGKSDEQVSFAPSIGTDQVGLSVSGRF